MKRGGYLGRSAHAQYYTPATHLDACLYFKNINKNRCLYYLPVTGIFASCTTRFHFSASDLMRLRN